MTDLSCHSESLLLTLNNNYGKSSNAIIVKMIGGKRINCGMRDSYYVKVLAAVLQYNIQSLWTKLHESSGYEIRQYKRALRNIRGRRKRRNAFGADADYGDNPKRPDLDKEAYDILVQDYFKKLQDDQKNHEEIEFNTRNQSECELWYQKISE